MLWDGINIGGYKCLASQNTFLLVGSDSYERSITLGGTVLAQVTEASSES